MYLVDCLVHPVESTLQRDLFADVLPARNSAWPIMNAQEILVEWKREPAVSRAALDTQWHSVLVEYVSPGE